MKIKILDRILVALAGLLILLGCAALIPACDVVADVGTDHGYLPVLDDRLQGVEIVGEISLGVHEIPLRILKRLKRQDSRSRAEIVNTCHNLSCSHSVTADAERPHR